MARFAWLSRIAVPTEQRARCLQSPVSRLWLLLIGSAILGGVVLLASKRHTGPNRCDPGWVHLGARCCAPGQRLLGGACAGEPAHCPRNFHHAKSPTTGCARDPDRVRFNGAFLSLGPDDWQSVQVPPIERRVAALWVDTTEVTYEQWQACVDTKRCAPKPPGEPGQPVVGVTPLEARQYCAAHGGRLPTVEERIALAAGSESRRYPWGQTGLVCRRAMYGVSNGPCAEGGSQPDVTGAHTAGHSPEGVLDLSGNVAEIALDAQQRVWSCGGSFRSNTASELKSWACSLFLGTTDDIGFRCVYDTAGVHEP